jgi:formylglycine-generating enzyme required for sulfatase activity
VELTRPFYLGTYPVTQREFQAVMGDNPSHFTPDHGGGPLHPVEHVSWEDCRAFCERLSAEEPGRTCGLPAESEWEYACRAGTTARYHFGDDPALLGDYAWYCENADARPHKVGTRKPNPFGLYDMHGNVWEWCADGYDERYYRSGPKDGPWRDPPGPEPEKPTQRVLRGGSWFDNARDCRAADRAGLDPATRYSFYGFRVALRLD